MVEVTVRSRVLGQERHPGQGDISLDLADSATVEDVISAAVAAQIGVVHPDGPGAWDSCSRLYLTDDEIRTMAARGVVRTGEQATGAPDVAVEQKRAVAAFRNGVFVVFAGGRQFAELDEPVTVADGDRLVFLRLTPLAGG